MAKPNDGLVFAFMLDGRGGVVELDWDGVRRHWNDDALLWVHLDYSRPTTKAWLTKESGLDAITCDALVSADTRPRTVAVADGLLVNLRGVNANPGADPHDMISLRMWIEHNRLITLRQRRLTAVDEVKEELKSGRGPRNAVALLLSLTERMVSRAGAVIAQLEDEIDALEEEVVTHESHALRGRIASARRAAIEFRRFLSPQRDAMSVLMLQNVTWIGDRDRGRLREVTDRVTRYVEDLDSIRDRAAVTQEELASRLAEHTNRMMYILSLLAGMFLPLGLLTGLLGINVGGIPGSNYPWAFWLVCSLLVVITLIEIIVLRTRKWL